MVWFGLQPDTVKCWLQRFGRVPRWAWIAIFSAVVIPIALLVLAVILVGLLLGLMVFFVIAAFMILHGLCRRLLLGRRSVGHSNVLITVRSWRP